MEPQRWIVSEDDAGERLDVVVAGLAAVTRSQVRRWVNDARVRVNGHPGRASQRVREGDAIAATPPEPIVSPLAPEEIPLPILYEDGDLVVIDKPAGLVVHPAPGHPGGTLVNALLHHCGDLAGVGGVLRPGIVHRLDRGTSGVMVVAKRDTAHRALAEQFQAHSIEREYRALVRALPSADAGRVDRAIGRHRRDRKRMSVHSVRGRASHTAWRVLRRYAEHERTWLSVRPETGRTHQIRVHLASVGLPIVGDPVYGRRSKVSRARLEAEAALSRPALHAARLGFSHPTTGEALVFEAELARDLAALLDALAGAGES